MIRRLLPVKDVPFQRCYCFSAYASLSDTEIISAIRNRTLPLHALENVLQPNYTRAIKLRREMLREKLASHTHQNSTRSLDEPSEHDCVLDGDTDPFINIPFEQFEWSQVIGRNCENIVGYVTVPIGVAGPVTINGVKYMIPMATTEGALVASTSRGTKAISASGGCTVRIVSDAMTRAPVVLLPTMDRACELISWCDVNLKKLQEEFRQTTTIGKLTGIRCVLIGRRVHLRMKAFTGDAMGMNMLTKGTQHLLEYISHSFPDMKVLSVSGNYCTDKKPSAVNWVEGRGKTVGAEAIVRREIVVNVLKSTPEDVCNLHRDKNLVGSALAGSIGGFNAHAANVVAAIFLATGQDPAQVVEGSHCLTHYEVTREGDLYAALTMPALEVGTTGGGTDLRVQRAALDLIGCGGPHIQKPGTNANILATLIAGSVLCAELSIMCAQAAGHLVEAHLRLNRAKKV